MATLETIEECLFLLRSTREFPFVAIKKDEFGNPIRPGTANAWQLALQHLTDEQVRAGTQYLLSTMTDKYKQNPTPADIVNFVNRAEVRDPGEVWAEIEEKKWQIQSPPFVRELGRCVAPSWSCKFVADVVQQMGGVEAFIHMRTNQEPTMRAQLRDICESLARRQSAKHVPVPGLEAPKDPTIALIAEARARKEQREAAEAEIADQKVRSKMAELRALMDAQKAARDKEKIERRRIEQQSLVRTTAEMQGIELTTFILPEVKKA